MPDLSDPPASHVAPATPDASPAPASPPGPVGEMPPRFFWIALAYLLTLIAVFAAYQLSSAVRDALPDSLGALPIGVPWFGAMGGALISLSGTTTHRSTWNRDYEYWHYTRPFVGAVIGSIGTLILLVVVRASTTSAPTLDDLALYVVAFIVGYREESFRGLIKRGADLLLAPGESTNKPDGSKTS